MSEGTSIVRAPGSIPTRLSRWEPRRTYSWLVVTGILALIVWSGIGTRSDLRVFLHGDAWFQIWTFVRSFFPPDLSGDFVRRSLWSGVETVAVSLMGMVLAILIGLPLGILSSRTVLTTSPVAERDQAPAPFRLLRRLVYWVSTLALNWLRSIPEVFWALIFILAVGLGPFAGVLALGVHTGGVLGKLFSEVFENVDPQPIETLHATGARAGAVVLYGYLPLALPYKDAPGLGHRVTILNLDGQMLCQFGDPFEGEGPGQFIGPHGVCADSRGDIYVGEVSYTVRGSHEKPPREMRSFQKFTRKA